MTAAPSGSWRLPALRWSPMTGVWVAVLAAVVATSAVAWTFARQQRFLDHVSRERGYLRQARVDLAKGYLHLSLASREGAPFERSQGLALLGQALRSLARTAEEQEAFPERGRAQAAELEALSRAVARFRDQLLAQDAGTPDARAGAEARIAFLALERQADAIEALLQEDLAANRVSHERLQRWALAAAVLVLALICAAVFVSGRAQERTTAALRQSEGRLRFAMEGANDGTWEVDLRTGSVFLSPRGCDMFGWSPAEFRADIAAWSQMVHPDDLASTQAALDRYLAGEVDLFRVEQRLRTRGGEYRWVLARGKASERDGAGRPVRMTGTHTDITQRKAAEEALTQSLLRFQLASRATYNVIWDWDLQADTIWRNENFATLFGYAPEAVDPSGRLWVGRVHPDDRARIDQGIRAAIASPQTLWSDEYRFLRGDGTWARVMDRGYITRDAAGRPLRMIGAMEDVSERKRAEAEHERLIKAIEQAAETVVVTDAQGTILYVNPAFESVTGYTRAEALGRNPRLLKSGAQDAAFYRSLWETISAGRTWRGRLVNRRKDGVPFTEEATISPVRDAAGAIASYVAVKRDITRDLALESQLLQAQKMEGIGRLAGGIAHDFNNIVAVILGSASFALEELPEGSPLRGDLEEIERAARRAASLTRQLLAFSRKQVLQPVPLDLNRVLAEMEKMLRRLIGEDVDLLQHLAPGLGLVTADPGQIEQVVMNLAINARDAMPEGGKLTIATQEVELDADYVAAHPYVAPGPHVMLSVEDSGVGMAPETVARAFEPFFTTKPKGQGTGLGLSTVYGIVKQSGGHIAVYSEPGQGTTFKVYLPRRAAAAAEPAPAGIPVGATAHGVETVLVVEDDEGMRKFATRVLGNAGYTVLAAGNGVSALELCARHPGAIDLLLTDVIMPEMNGKDLSRRLCEQRPGLKLLFMSGYTDDAIVHHGILEAGVHFIGKPFAQAELLRKVREALDSPAPGRGAAAARLPAAG